MVRTSRPSVSHRARIGPIARYGLGLLVATALAAPNCRALAEAGSAETSESVDVEVNKKGLGKEVIVRRGSHEWYMLVEVTPDNTVIVRQHKNGDAYLLDESETHDRPFSPQEVDGAIDAFASSAKSQAASQK